LSTATPINMPRGHQEYLVTPRGAVVTYFILSTLILTFLPLERMKVDYIVIRTLTKRIAALTTVAFKENR
jgi:hypothetical protein